MRVVCWIFTLSLCALIHKKSVKVVGGKVVFFIIDRSYRKDSHEVQLWDLTCYLSFAAQ